LTEESYKAGNNFVVLGDVDNVSGDVNPLQPSGQKPQVIQCLHIVFVIGKADMFDLLVFKKTNDIQVKLSEK